jgi:hypothetical protein
MAESRMVTTTEDIAAATGSDTVRERVSSAQYHEDED